MRSILVAAVCVGLCFGGAKAQTPPKVEEDLNAIMALRAKTMLEAHQLQMEIRQFWADPTCTSPEIEALRKKIVEFQEAIVRTQDEIKAKIEELPQVRPIAQKVKEANKKIEELNKKIEAKQEAN